MHLLADLHCIVSVGGLSLDHRHNVPLLQGDDGGRHRQAVLREVGHHARLGAKDAHACLCLARLRVRGAARVVRAARRV